MQVTAYMGRVNEDQFELVQDGKIVDPGVVTRAVLKFGEHCIDTDVDTTIISLDDDAQVVKMTLGLIEDLSEGSYVGKLTIYDAVAVKGFAWYTFNITVKSWEVCE